MRGGSGQRAAALAAISLLLLVLAPLVAAQRLECVQDGGGNRDLFPLAAHRGRISVRPLTLNGRPAGGDDRSGSEEDGVGELTEAQDFQIFYHRTFKVVLNKRMEEAYVLHQCGVANADADQVTAALEAANVNTTAYKVKSFSVPLTSVAVETTVSMAFMEDLKLHPRIKFLPSFAASGCSQRLLGCQDESFNKSLAAHTDGIEAIIRSDTAAYPGSYPAELEDKIIQFSASQDPGALARAEWHKFIGAFFNKELQAEQLFGDIAESFEEFEGRESTADAPIPSVVWCNYRSWSADLPVECFTGGRFQYKHDLVAAAGGRLLNSSASDDSSALFSLSDEAAVASLHAYLQQADAFVDETYAADGDAYTLDTFTQNFRINSTDDGAFPFLTNKLVLRVDKAIGSVSGGSEWFQTAISRPDLVAKNFAKYIAPELLQDAEQDSYFVRNVAVGELTMSVSPDECALATCEAIIADASENPICPLDIRLCGDGGNYMRASFRDNKNGCEFEEACERPGLKDRQPLECLNDDDRLGSGDKGAFPLVFGQDGTIRIEDGSETSSAPVMANLTAAEDFTVSYFDSFKVVINVRMQEVYVLYQCGSFPPTVEEVGNILATEMELPAALVAAPTVKFFSIPLQSVAVDATVPVAMMEDLRLHPRVTHISSYVATPCSQKLLSCGSALNHSDAQHVDRLDAIIRADTLAYPGSYPSSVEGKVIQFSASQDPGALQRAEWVKFVGMFFNRELQAERLYDDVAATYTALKEAASAVGGPKAVVAWCSHYSASVSCSTNVEYKTDLTEAAGGIIADASTQDRTVYFNAQGLREYLSQVDVLIDESYAADNNAYTLETFKENYQLNQEGDAENFKFLATQSVYRLDKAIGAETGGQDWFQTGISRPDMVVQDLISFITPEASPAGHVTHFFRNIAKGEGIEEMRGEDCRLGGTEELSCDAFLQSVQDNPICPLDLKTCGTTTHSRMPEMNCEFPQCGISVPEPPPVPETATDIVVVSAEYSLADVTSVDFADILNFVFRRSVADIAKVNIADVRVTEQSTSDKAVVAVDVIFDDKDKAAAFKNALTQSTAEMFPDSLGRVAVAKIESFETQYADYLDSGVMLQRASVITAVLCMAFAVLLAA